MGLCSQEFSIARIGQVLSSPCHCRYCAAHTFMGALLPIIASFAAQALGVGSGDVGEVGRVAGFAVKDVWSKYV